MRIAIVKLSAMGDIVHAMVALQFIKAHNPDIQIDWVVEERFAGVLQDNPQISEILTINLKALKQDKTLFFKELKKIRTYANNQYDLVIDAQGLIKSGIIARLLSKKVAGFDQFSIREKAASWFYTIKLACAYDKNTIDRNAFVLSSPLNFKISREDILEKKPFLFAAKPKPLIYTYFSKEDKNIIFVIGSSWETKNYPAEKFVKIAQSLQQNCLVIWGSEAEKIKAEWMTKQYDKIKVMPKLDLNDLKSAIALADLVIGNDTGPTHMAWALNKPSITIFGPTPIRQTYQTDINKVVKSPSIVNPFKLNKMDGSIKDIDAQTIIDLAQPLLHDRSNL